MPIGLSTDDSYDKKYSFSTGFDSNISNYQQQANDNQIEWEQKYGKGATIFSVSGGGYAS